MAKSLLEKAGERLFLNTVSVWGRKAANAIADKAQKQIEQRTVAQRTKMATKTDNEEAPEDTGDLGMID